MRDAEYGCSLVMVFGGVIPNDGAVQPTEGFRHYRARYDAITRRIDLK